MRQGKRGSVLVGGCNVMNEIMYMCIIVFHHVSVKMWSFNATFILTSCYNMHIVLVQLSQPWL